jgi:PAS domain S-box-containing protein
MNETNKNTPADINVAQEVYKKNVQLLSERRRTELLLYSVSEIVFSVATDYRITLFNHTAEKLFNIEDEDVLGNDVNDFIKVVTEKDIPIKAQEYCFQKEDKDGVVEGVILKTPHGDRYVNIKTSIITQEGVNTECVVTMVDVTREMQLDKTKETLFQLHPTNLEPPSP